MIYYFSTWFFSLAFFANGYDINQGNGTYLIDTPNCKIRNFTTKYKHVSIDYNVCGIRHIFVKTALNNQVTFYMANNFYKACLYRFIYPSSRNGRVDLDVTYDSWKPFSNGTTMYLLSDFIKVHCYRTTKGYFQIYDDLYAKINKVDLTDQSIDERVRGRDDKRHWNVLMIGMGSMSRERAYQDLTNTVDYFKKDGWIDFKGYNMAADTTFPNLMSVLTNKNISSLVRLCKLDMSMCNDAFIWSRFKDTGYATAFGEDSIDRNYSETSKNIMRFRKPPTDHYIRTLFLDGERKIGLNYCTKTMLSVKHVFSYAYEFVKTYRKDKFFGCFWINSLSLDPDQSPASFDVPLLLFFKKLQKLGVLNNTFIIFFSNHGLGYSDINNDVAAVYYEKRLPMLFIKVPNTFRRVYPEKYVKLYLQQSRLISTFDLHLTLWDIAVNFEKLYPLPNHEGCQKCYSLFDTIELNRTCADAGIVDTWCTCHDLEPFLENHDYGVYYSLNKIMLRLHNITENMQTLPFTRCQELKLSKLSSVRKYLVMPKMFYIIEGILSPDRIGFQANVSKHVIPEFSVDTLNSKFKYQIESLNITTNHESRLQCVLNETDKVWCLCEKMKM